VKRLTYAKTVRAVQLLDEIMARVPGLRPVAGPGGVNVARIQLTADGSSVDVWVPDDTGQDDQDAVAATVAAHTPVTPPVPPAPDYGTEMVDLGTNAAAAVQQMRDFINNAAPTNAQVVANLKLINRLGLWLVKQRVG
jgi:hypothetical protein